MIIRAGYEISLDYPESTAVIATLLLHPSRLMSMRKPEFFQVSPYTPYTEYMDLYGNRCARVFVAPGRTTFMNDFTVEDDGLPDPQVWDARQHQVE